MYDFEPEASAVKVFDDSLFLQEAASKRTQYGALCWRLRRGAVQVLLVTSRDTGRWVIPKGWPHDGMGGMESAEIEAWEEAGVKGTIDPRCLGLFSYYKAMAPADPVPCIVGVYGLRVQSLMRNFPERKERRRKWFTLEKAVKRVGEPELRVLLMAMKGKLPLPDLEVEAISDAPLPRDGSTP